MQPKPLKLAEIILLVAVVIGGAWWLAGKPAQVQPIPPADHVIQIYPGTNYRYITYPNPQRLSAEDFLKQNYELWLGTPSQYSDFFVNESATFDGLPARKFGTERDTYYLITKGDEAFLIMIKISSEP